MLKDKDRAAYFEWWSYWISKVPASRDVIETLPGHLDFKEGTHADRARLRRHRTLTVGGIEGAHRGDESRPDHGPAMHLGIPMGDWED
jgi:hypothetical protein